MPSSHSKPSKPKADSGGIAQLKEWGSQSPIDNNAKIENEPPCFQFRLNLPKLPPPCADGDSPTAAANAVISLFGQVRIETDLASLIDAIRYQKDKADYEANRPGISCMILLAHSLGLVAEIDIDHAVAAGWEASYRLYQHAVARVMDHLNRVSMTIAGINVSHSDFEPMNLELRQSQNDGISLVLGVYPKFSRFSLLDMDRELAKAVAGCLKWTLFNGGIGMLVDDLCEMSMMGDELGALKEGLESHGHLSNGELATFFLENEVYPFIDLTDDREFLEEHLVYLKAILNNNGASTFGKLPAMGDISRMLSSWRQSNPAIYQNPWVTFIRESLKVWRWLKKSGLKASGYHLSPCDSQGDVSLDYGHIIGFGFDWEETVVEDILEDIAQVGENPEGIIRLNTLVFSEVGARLCLLAKSRGLIRLAEVINADFEAHCETH
ncbi:MAG: hypothetical protein NTV43_00110 [Methylococcales bacterium]|nr:hypothetical protein [Methylococcales bacterium]